MWQEPGSNNEIKVFCEKIADDFSVMERLQLREDQSIQFMPFLPMRIKMELSSSVTWNFQKYLIDEEGKLVDVNPTNTTTILKL